MKLLLSLLMMFTFAWAKEYKVVFDVTTSDVKVLEKNLFVMLNFYKALMLRHATPLKWRL